MLAVNAGAIEACANLRTSSVALWQNQHKAKTGHPEMSGHFSSQSTERRDLILWRSGYHDSRHLRLERLREGQSGPDDLDFGRLKRSDKATIIIVALGMIREYRGRPNFKKGFKAYLTVIQVRKLRDKQTHSSGNKACNSSSLDPQARSSDCRHKTFCLLSAE